MEQRSDNKIFVGGLSYQTTDYSLAVYFGQYGQLLESKIVYDRATGQSKAYGFVTFANPASAQAAVANPNPVIDGKTVNCNLASAKSNPAASSTGATAASSAPETPFLEIIRSQGEDISPEAVEYGIAQRYQTNPIDAFLFFLERAELFRGMPEFQYYSVNLLNAVKAYRSDGSIMQLPSKSAYA